MDHDDDVELHVLGCRVDILGTNCSRVSDDDDDDDDVELHVLGCRLTY